MSVQPSVCTLSEFRLWNGEGCGNLGQRLKQREAITYPHPIHSANDSDLRDIPLGEITHFWVAAY
jgi:hypothetical protein